MVDSTLGYGRNLLGMQNGSHWSRSPYYNQAPTPRDEDQAAKLISRVGPSGRRVVEYN